VDGSKRSRKTQTWKLTPRLHGCKVGEASPPSVSKTHLTVHFWRGRFKTQQTNTNLEAYATLARLQCGRGIAAVGVYV
jgi:hypothetical protein